MKEAHHWSRLAKLKLTWLARVCLVQNGWRTWFSEGQCCGTKFETTRTCSLLARCVGRARDMKLGVCFVKVLAKEGLR